MVKTYVPNYLLVECFIKSLFPSITEDVAKGVVVTEEEVIARAQYLDLIYTQSSMLYGEIPHAPHLNESIPPPPSNRDCHAEDGVISSLSMQMVSKPSGQSLAKNKTVNAREVIPSNINVVSFDKGKDQKQPGSKKNGKNKSKTKNPPQEKSFDSSTSRKKLHYPCLICDNDHSTRDCPHYSKISKLLKSSTAFAVLTDPFPKLDTNMVAIENSSTSQVLMLSIAKPKYEVLVQTRNKDYGNPPSSSNNQDTNQLGSSTSTTSENIPLPIAPELTIKEPKGVVHKSTFNPRARAAQNYNIVKYLSQYPSAMSMFEVLQNFPS